MTVYPSPTRAQVLAALTKHKVNFITEALRAQAEGRPWSSGLRAIVDHHTAGTHSLGYLLNSGGRYPFVNSLTDRDGKVHILSTQSTWGSGAGGPWTGVAARNSLHLVAWQNEVEDLGIHQTFTDAQLESLGRMNAALLSLGVPAAHEINHRDWTDGTGGVSPVPLPTKGRKPDTKYEAEFLRANTAKYKLVPTKPPAPKPPVFAYRQGKKVYRSKMHKGQLNSDSVWNLTLALRARRFRTEIPIDDYTQDVVNDCAAFQRSQGWTGSGADGIGGPLTVKRLGLIWVAD